MSIEKYRRDAIMVKVLYGSKGTGKTKKMLEDANNLARESSGVVVFIDDSNELLIKLSHKIRFINILDYPVYGSEAFLGFLCGVVSQNYDIETIFIDGLTYIVHQDAESLKKFFEGVSKISKEHDVNFYMSINGDENNIPVFIKEYAV
jgi:thymidine kinase